MNEEIEFGLTIMAVGMITVFSILTLVVLGGKIMILLINRFTPDLEELNPPQLVSQTISNVKISVLASAVTAVTNGKGRIEQIEKL